MISMTGMGRAGGSFGSTHFFVEIRSVNHKYCEVSTRLPSRLQALEFLIVQAVKKKIVRGKVDVWIGEEKGIEDTLPVNKKALKKYYHFLETLRKELKLKEPVGLSHLQQGASLWTSRDMNVEKYWPPLKKLIEGALKDLIQMRGKEGENLGNQIGLRLKFLEEIRETIAQEKQNILETYKKKLEGRIQQILSSVEVDPMKLANEVAFFADRSDITEELERLSSHFSQFKKLMKSNEPCGRPLDFLIQEINREWNTIASKAQSAAISQKIVTAKSEMEKIREQVQNIE